MTSSVHAHPAASPEAPVREHPRPSSDSRSAGFRPVPHYPARADGTPSLTGEPDDACHPTADDRVDGGVLALLRRSTTGTDPLHHDVAPKRDEVVVIRRYFDGWPASQAEAPRKARFDTIVDNAVAAGISSHSAEAAGLVVLQKWDGWSNHFADDFDYAWVSRFRDTLHEQLIKEGGRAAAIKPLLDVVFARDAQRAELERLGRAAGYEPGGQRLTEQLDLDPDWEEDVIGHFADRFEERGQWEGQGAGFRAAWAHATVPEKKRVLVILLGPTWQTDDEHFQNPHLSDLSYVVEGVTGTTPGSPDSIKSWVKNPRGSLFSYMRDQPGYKTKYMSEQEREEYRLTIHDGHVYRADEKPLVGDNIFVLSLGGEFYGGSKQSGRDRSVAEKSDAIHHSSFMAGEPVSCAGHLYTDSSGLLTEISDQSGHYAPTDDEFGAFLYRLKHDLGVDLTRVSFRRKPADLFLLTWERENLPQNTTDLDPTSGDVRTQGMSVQQIEDDPFDENDIHKNPFI